MQKRKSISTFSIVVLFLCLFTIPAITGANGATYYVKSDGNDDFNGTSWETAKKTIQQTINNAGAGDIIIVGSSGTGHGTGVYTENVNVTKSLIIRSENGYATTTVHGSVTSDHVFEVQADSVTIGGEGCGFSIYGATNDEMAGIYLSGRTACTIQGNRCGWDSDQKSSYGILLSSSSNNTLTENTANSNSNYGIWLSSTCNNNTLTGNTCNSNQYFGIYLVTSSANTLTGNTCNSNSCGIPLSSSSNNILSGNTCNSNSGFGIGMVSSSNNNTLTGNTCNSNSDGIYLNLSSDNTIYLNNFSNTKNLSLYNSTNTWHSPTLLYYDYTSGSFHKNYLGNYYSDYDTTGQDVNRDGIGTAVYSATGMTDNYPLMDTSACYSLQAWWLSGDSIMYKDDMSKSIDSVTINSGSSNIWIDSQAPSLDTVCSNNRWTGQIIFTAPPSSDANFKVEIGYWDGANFTAGGPNTTINGNGSDSVFIFQTNSEAFTIDPGNKLAFKITNNSSKNYAVKTGGAWSYCSSALNNPEYISGTLYVATNGAAPNDGSSWEYAFTTIQAAVDAASAGDIIIVGSSGTGHGNGVYNENVNVTKSLTIKSESGYATTTVTVHGSVTNDHVFEVQADSVTIGGEGCGFSIYGATDNPYAGVYLSGRTGCIIQGNRCGWDSDHKSYYGIYLISSSNNTLMENTCNSNTYGIYLESSSNNMLTENTIDLNIVGIYLVTSSANTLSGNTANSNSNYGILLSSSSNNTLTENTNDLNIIGIYLINSSANTLTGNTCNSNNYFGIQLANSSNNNTFMGNTCNSNSYHGICLYSSSNNTLYLNNLSNNTNAYVEDCSGNIWHSPTMIYYDYNGISFHKNYLGNYYSDYSSSGQDPDGDGIGNSAYSVNDMNVDYPLMDTSACYLLQAWWLSGDSIMYKDDMSKSIDSVTLNSGSTNIWIADQATLIDINLPGTDSWTGQIVFTSAPANGETFTAEFGSSTNGSDFIAGGPDATISGKDTVTVFTFETDSRAFTVSAGSYLALRITNNSSKNYAVKTGGAWSYCSSPYSSYNYLVSVDNNSMNENVPKEYALHQNYPNPFNPVTTISYDLAEDVYVELTVYNIIGEKVTTLVKGNQPAGYYNIEWDGRNSRGLIVSSGMYLLRINAGNYCKTNKMVFVR